MAENHSRVLRGCCCAALGGVCWGVSGTCGQYLFAHYQVSTLWLTCLRLLSAGLLLLLLALPSHARELRKLPRHPKDLLLVAAYGIGGLTLCQYAYMTGITYANAATITVLQMLSILFVTVISCLLSRRRPRTKELLAVFLAMTGTFLLVTGGNPRQMILCAVRREEVHTLKRMVFSLDKQAFFITLSTDEVHGDGWLPPHE